MSPASAGSASATVESAEMPVREQEVSDGLNKNLDRNSEKPQSNKNIAAVQDVQQAQFGDDATPPLRDDGVYFD